MAVCLQEIKAQKNRDKKVFANMFDKFAKIDAKREEEVKKRETPVEIDEWKSSKRSTSTSSSDVLNVKGDINMDVDLNRALDEEDVDDD